MSLIQSISGIRGTIGGKPGDNLTPIDIVNSAAAYGSFLLKRYDSVKVVIGRDARMSGAMVNSLVNNTLIALGIDVVSCGLSTTPTVEMAVVHHDAQGGIILTASHNPKQWNALKLLNDKGEFLSGENGQEILDIIAAQDFVFAEIDNVGQIIRDNNAINRHIESIFQLSYVKVEEIKRKKYRVLVDCINSTGAISLVPMLEELGCEVVVINGEMTGDFAHTPEPLPKNLVETLGLSKSNDVDLGIVLDPDVDRIAFIDENGSFMGEEYSLVAIADYLLKISPSPSVSNLSSSFALQDVCQKHKVDYFSSAVGEVNVVAKMKEVGAKIGGEGNGGIILADLHYGRDSLVGAALFLSFMVSENKTASEIRSSYTNYYMVKDKMDVEGVDLEFLLNSLDNEYDKNRKDTIDGLKIYFDEGWVHLRKSNTEPIIRIYSESDSQEKAERLVNSVKAKMDQFV